jgi:hypothetical protein
MNVRYSSGVPRVPKSSMSPLQGLFCVRNKQGIQQSNKRNQPTHSTSVSSPRIRPRSPLMHELDPRTPNPEPQALNTLDGAAIQASKSYQTLEPSHPNFQVFVVRPLKPNHSRFLKPVPMNLRPGFKTSFPNARPRSP